MWACLCLACSVNGIPTHPTRSGETPTLRLLYASCCWPPDCGLVQHPYGCRGLRANALRLQCTSCCSTVPSACGLCSEWPPLQLMPATSMLYLHFLRCSASMRRGTQTKTSSVSAPPGAHYVAAATTKSSMVHEHSFCLQVILIEPTGENVIPWGTNVAPTLVRI